MEEKKVIITIAGGCVQNVIFDNCPSIDIVLKDYDIEEPEILLTEGTYDIRCDDEGDYYEQSVWKNA